MHYKCLIPHKSFLVYLVKMLSAVKRAVRIAISFFYIYLPVFYELEVKSKWQKVRIFLNGRTDDGKPDI